MKVTFAVSCKHDIKHLTIDINQLRICIFIPSNQFVFYGGSGFVIVLSLTLSFSCFSENDGKITNLIYMFFTKTK